MQKVSCGNGLWRREEERIRKLKRGEEFYRAVESAANELRLSNMSVESVDEAG